MTDQQPNKPNSPDRKPNQGSKGPGGPNGPTPPPGQPGPPRASRGQFGWLLIAAVAMLLFIAFQTLGPPRTEMKWSEFAAAYNEGTTNNPVLTDIVLTPTAINATRQAVNDTQPVHIRVVINPQALDTTKQQLNELTKGNYKERGPSVWNELLSPGFLLLGFFVFIWIMIARGLRGAGGAGGMLGNFGKSRHRVLAKEQTGVTFADVAGVDEAKEEVQEIVQFLKNPKKFMKLGGRIPRGVLLVGPPGCGKTLLAKAIAGEADVPFFTISGSDFVEMFVGVGASRVRDLFKQAKDSSPCIIFLDEIDAVGRRRGSGFSSGGHDEREQTLNAILVEMDGFDSSDQVIVIAATNRADVLDPALTRPGRFDRQVIVTLPDVQGRYEILKVHAKKVRLSPEVDMLRIARQTPMFSGAELEAIINEAAIIATLADKEFVEQDDLEEARDKVRYGRSRKSRVIEEKERVATAYHEAGHAVVQMLMPEADPLHKVTIIPRGQAMGATFSLPEKDRYGYGLRWLSATMRVMCGGRIAEKRKTEDISSGASMDIQQVTELARHMVLEWGMSDRLGFVRYSGSDTRESFLPEREYSEETARIIDEEIRKLATDAYADAERLIEDNWDKVVAVAEALLKHETLSVEEVRLLMRGESLDRPTVSDLIEAEARKQNPPRQSKPRTDYDKGIDPGMLPSPA
ncbi:MAG: ATP-dependent zinc metalloprotease FtsH [Phycisphaerales bacterium]|nr:ATP-dependent zinc metalloprotease FtsH [Phycisphaerales bacterium]